MLILNTNLVHERRSRGLLNLKVFFWKTEIQSFLHECSPGLRSVFEVPMSQPLFNPRVLNSDEVWLLDSLIIYRLWWTWAKMEDAPRALAIDTADHEGHHWESEIASLQDALGWMLPWSIQADEGGDDWAVGPE